MLHTYQASPGSNGIASHNVGLTDDVVRVKKEMLWHECAEVAAQNAAWKLPLEYTVHDLTERVKRQGNLLSDEEITGIAYAPIKALSEPEKPEEQISAYDPEKDPWKPLTLADAYQERPAKEWTVGNTFCAPAVWTLVGASGSHKTNLLMDMCVSTAIGGGWLPGLPNQNVQPIPTRKTPVIWVNEDTGTDTCLERLAAFARARGIQANDDFPYNLYSYQSPALDASNAKAIAALKDRILFYGAGVVPIDNLQLITGGADENSATEMGPIMRNIKRLAEETNCIIVLIHHVNKGGAYRGSTSIDNLIDGSLIVEREEHSNTITVKQGKCRGAEVAPFSAMFTYEHKPGTKELLTARFYGVPADGGMGADELQEEILRWLVLNPGFSKTMAVDRIHELTGDDAGRDQIRAALEHLIRAGKIQILRGQKNAKILSLP